MGKKNKNKKKHDRYINDVIGYYGMMRHHSDNFFSLEACTSEEVHNIAEKIFGKSYYIDYDFMSKDAILS